MLTAGVNVNLKRNIILFYILSLPLIDVFSFSNMMPIPLILGLLVLLVCRKIKFNNEDFLLLGMILLCILPYIWSGEYIGVKTLLHLLALITSVLIYYFVSRYAISYLFKIDAIESLLNIICYSIIITSAYILAEYISKNIIHFDIEGYVQHLSRVEYVSTVLEDKNRPRGFATESGIMSIFYEMYIFILFYFLSKFPEHFRKSLLIKLAILSSFVGIILLFSSAAITVLFIGVCIVVFYEGIGLKKTTVLFLLIFAFFLVFREQIILFFINTFMNKISILVSGELIGSAAERASIYNSALGLIFKYPFGIGFGIAPEVASNNTLYYGEKVSAGQVSLFLTITLAGGFFSLLFISTWLILKAKRLLKSGLKKGYLVATLGCIIIHYTLVSEFWIPFFWFTIALTEELASTKMVYKQNH